MHQRAAISGSSAVALFRIALIAFSILNPEFSFLKDNISKIGAIGQPNALEGNLIGFVAVGLLLAAFGWGYGNIFAGQNSRSIAYGFWDWIRRNRVAYRFL